MNFKHLSDQKCCSHNFFNAVFANAAERCSNFFTSYPVKNLPRKTQNRSFKHIFEGFEVPEKETKEPVIFSCSIKTHNF